MKTKALIALLALACFATAGAQEDDKSDAAAERWGHLEKGKSGFRETWVNPDADFSKYDNLYLWEGEFEYRDVGPARRSRGTMMNTRQREFGISDEDRVRFEEILSEAFVKEIQKARKFTVTDQIGPRTLIMRGAVLDIVSLVPPELIGPGEIYLSTLGEATLVLELIDAEDGEVVAVVAERRRIQSGTGRIDDFSMPTNRATVTAEIKRWAGGAARKLRTALDKAIADR